LRRPCPANRNVAGRGQAFGNIPEGDSAAVDELLNEGSLGPGHEGADAGWISQNDHLLAGTWRRIDERQGADAGGWQLVPQQCHVGSIAWLDELDLERFLDPGEIANEAPHHRPETSSKDALCFIVEPPGRGNMKVGQYMAFVADHEAAACIQDLDLRAVTGDGDHSAAARNPKRLAPGTESQPQRLAALRIDEAIGALQEHDGLGSC